jgi:hypothetical protein
MTSSLATAFLPQGGPGHDIHRLVLGQAVTGISAF